MTDIEQKARDMVRKENGHGTLNYDAAMSAKYGDDWRDEPTARDLELEASL